MKVVRIKKVSGGVMAVVLVFEEYVLRLTSVFALPAKERVNVVSQLSEEFEVKVEKHQGSVLSPILFAVVLDVVTELT